jgi:hypothetical protein
VQALCRTAPRTKKGPACSRPLSTRLTSQSFFDFAVELELVLCPASPLELPGPRDGVLPPLSPLEPEALPLPDAVVVAPP